MFVIPESSRPLARKEFVAVGKGKRFRITIAASGNDSTRDVRER